MAYFLNHICTFQNREVENMVIELYRKDVEPDEITDIRATGFRVSYGSGKGNKLDDIITCEATLGIWLPPSSPLTYQDFIIIFQDDWMIKAYSDSQIVFQGFLNPSEGDAAFKDKPYELTLSATDGLALLKDEPISTFGSEEFTSTHTLISIISHILEKTGLELPIEMRANIYEESMEDRDANGDADFTAFTKLHYKSLLKSATEYMSCWDFLMMFCHQHFSLYQWFGHWVFNRFTEMQDNVGPTNWYTLYEKEDDVLISTGGIDLNAYARIGRNLKLHPVNANQRISSKFPIKSARHDFTYVPWEEIPTNNKWERGTLSLLYSGVDYQSYILDTWQVGEVDPNFPFGVTPNGGVAGYRKSTFNNFGIETKRELVLRTQPFILGGIKSDGTPVNTGDKLNLTLDFRTEITETETALTAAKIYIVSEDGLSYYTWRNTIDDRGSVNQWVLGPSVETIRLQYYGGTVSTDLQSVSIESPPFPIAGTMFIIFQNVNETLGQAYYYSGFNLEYIPFTMGGYLPLSGDYWITSQDANYKDAIEEEVGLSDCLIKVVKGTLFRADGVTLTTPTWHRFRVTEQRHYKELLNLGVYNHAYRPQWRVSGTFGGTKFSPVSDPTLMEPISFHKHFLFYDAPELFGVLFMAVPPLSIDYHLGRVDGTFVDCINSNEYDVGTPSADDVLQTLIRAINNTTIPEWQAQAGAPPEGTLYFPPQANLYPNTPLTIRIVTTYDSSPYAAADDNGVGNSPTITETGNFNFLTRKVMYYTLGEDVQVGNRFIISLYGVQVEYTVGGQTLYHDGRQMGDGHFFNYTFK